MRDSKSKSHRLKERRRLVEDILGPRGVRDSRIIEALLRVPREEFVPKELKGEAYANAPLPIGHAQTISQPLIVGLMSQLLRLKPGDRVLEIGTGSGYQTAILLELGADVYSIERIEDLSRQARSALDRAGYQGAQLRVGDGYMGWPDKAPFDAIIVTAAPSRIPQALCDQLKEGGRMVIPVGEAGEQSLEVLEKRQGQIHRERHGAVAFVPLKHGVPKACPEE